MKGLFRRYLGRQPIAVASLFLLLCVQIGLDLLGPQVVRRLIDGLETRSPVADLVRVALLFLTVAAARIPLRILEAGVSQRVAWNATNALRSDLARHVMGLDLGFHNDHTPGELLERIDGDAKRLGSFFSDLLPGVVTTGLLAIGILTVLCVEDWRLALMVALFLLAFVLLHRWDQRWAVPHWRKERAYATELSSYVEERVGGVRDVHTAGATTHVLEVSHGLLRRHASQAVRAEIVTDVAWSVSNGFYALGVAAAMVASGHLFLHGAISLGAVYLLIHYLQTLHGPMAGIGGRLEDLLRSRVSIQRIGDLFALSAPRRQRGARVLPRGLPLEVRAAGVSFGYHPGTPVLEDVSFTLAPGESLGLVGRTGSGKTTLSRLLFGFHEPWEGSIHLGGFDTRDMALDELRCRVAVITQNVQMFRCSVRDNVTLFRPDIGDGRILEILRRIGLEGWLDTLDRGLDTVVSAEDGRLSGGQAQLLAVARAFLKDPGLVILDEASSRLDPETERLLDVAVRSLLAGRTALIIAHRLATVRQVDNIMILERGRVMEYGPYAELAGRHDSALGALLRAGQGEVRA